MHPNYTRKNIQNELGIAFIFVTHDQEEALTMSDKIIVMNQGKIIQLALQHKFMIIHPANLQLNL